MVVLVKVLVWPWLGRPAVLFVVAVVVDCCCSVRPLMFGVVAGDVCLHGLDGSIARRIVAEVIANGCWYCQICCGVRIFMVYFLQLSLANFDEASLLLTFVCCG